MSSTVMGTDISLRAVTVLGHGAIGVHLRPSRT